MKNDPPSGVSINAEALETMNPHGEINTYAKKTLKIEYSVTPFFYANKFLFICVGG